MRAGGKPVLRVYGVGIVVGLFAQAPDPLTVGSRDDFHAYVGVIKVRVRHLTGDVREDDEPLESFDALDTGQLDTTVRERVYRPRAEDQRGTRGPEVPGTVAQQLRHSVVLGAVREVTAHAREADRGVGSAGQRGELPGEPSTTNRSANRAHRRRRSTRLDVPVEALGMPPSPGYQAPYK